MTASSIAAGLAALAAIAGTEPAADPSPPTPSFLEVADRLRSMGSYSECVVEALRHAYGHPADRQPGFDRAALCLVLAGRFEDARGVLLTLRDEGQPLGAPARLTLCLTEVFMRDLGLPVCPQLVPRSSRERQDLMAGHTLAMRAIRGGRWSEAKELLARAASDGAEPTLTTWLARDRAFVLRHDTLPRKSPWLAGALSAVVPGLGRVYLGQWQDALSTLVLVGVAAGLAAHGFYEDGVDSVRGWVLGTTAAVFHAGNIYGSAIGAVVQRRDAEDALMKEIDREYRRRLEH